MTNYVYSRALIDNILCTCQHVLGSIHISVTVELIGMATGYAAEYTANVAQDHDRSLYKPNVQLLSFISTSAGWIYPIDRFFGRALYGKKTSLYAYGDIG